MASVSLGHLDKVYLYRISSLMLIKKSKKTISTEPGKSLSVQLYIFLLDLEAHKVKPSWCYLLYRIVR